MWESVFWVLVFAVSLQYYVYVGFRMDSNKINHFLLIFIGILAFTALSRVKFQQKSFEFVQFYWNMNENAKFDAIIPIKQ